MSCHVPWLLVALASLWELRLVSIHCLKFAAHLTAKHAQVSIQAPLARICSPAFLTHDMRASLSAAVHAPATSASGLAASIVMPSRISTSLWWSLMSIIPPPVPLFEPGTA